jgi:hypothetical protein
LNEELLNVRHKEIDQAIPKDQGHQPGTTPARERQLPCSEAEDNEIEGHPIDEGSGKDLVVCINDRARA